MHDFDVLCFANVQQHANDSSKEWKNSKKCYGNKIIFAQTN